MRRSFLTSKRLWLTAAAAAVVLILFIGFVHPFLAINRHVTADTLVIEGWVPEYAVDQAAAEFRAGKYRAIFVSGMVFEKDNPRFTAGASDAAIVASWLAKDGIPSNAVVTCPVVSPSFNRTSHMARAVRDRMHEMLYQPQGVNVVTLGPHARQSLLAYTRMLGDTTSVGVISYPKNDYNPERWWTSSAGIAKTTKDFAGWLKELLFGLRS